MLKSQIIFFFSFLTFFGVDFIIKTYTNLKSSQIKNYYNKFINLNYFTILTLLFIFFTIIFFSLSWLLPSIFPINLFPNDFTFELNFPKGNSFMPIEGVGTIGDVSNSSSSISGSGSTTSPSTSGSGTNIVNNISGVENKGNVNLNTPHFNVSLPASALNNVGAGIAASGGAAAAAKIVQKFPGPPAVKAALGAGAIMLTSASAAVAGRYMNSNINPNNETNKSGNNFIMD